MGMPKSAEDVLPARKGEEAASDASNDTAAKGRPETAVKRAEGVSAAERWRPALVPAATGLFVLLGWWLEGRSPWASVALALAFVVGGYRPAWEGLQLLSQGQLHVDLLMVIAGLGAAAIGMPVDGAILIFIFALSNALEDYALGRSRREMMALMALRPTHAALWRDGEEQLVPVEQLEIGHEVIVRPGEQIPCDGDVVRGVSLVDQASITGESIPVEKVPGHEVFAGTINETGTILVRVTKEPGETTLDRIVSLVEQARTQKSETQQTVDRIERIYSWSVVIVVAATFLVLWLGLGWTVQDASFRSLVLLIIASPCAVVLSSMPATLSAMSNGARNGILIKGGGYLEQLGRIRVVAFDKTGTLTTGKPVVAAVEPVDSRWTAQDILSLSASLEAMVNHPIGEAVLARAEAEGVAWEPAEGVQIHAGMGVSGRVKDHFIWIGSPERAASHAHDRTGERAAPDGDDGETSSSLASVLDRARAISRQGNTPVVVMVDGRPAGIIAIAESLRPGAEDVIRRLKKAGVEKIVMLTGDNETSAAMLAGRLGIDYRADLLPHDKAEAIHRLREQYGPVMMVGDGVNDGPALAAADVGMAMGAAGTDVAMEAADVVLMADDLTKIPLALRLGRGVNTIVTQNLTFAFAVIVGLILANFAGWLTLPMAVVGHEGSSLLVALNGLRMLRYR